MILESALIDIRPGREEAFVVAVAQSRPVLLSAPGAHSVSLLRCIEDASRFLLQVEWDDVAAHDTFRSSEAFAQWRAAVGDLLAGPPASAHYELVPVTH